MKYNFHLLSDTHLEFYSKDKNVHNLVDLITCDSSNCNHNTLLLAGDIGVALNRHGLFHHFIREFIKGVSKKFDLVFYVPGNHEYYMAKTFSISLDEIDLIIEENMKPYPNVHFLQKRSFDHPSGYTLLGCTMWSACTKLAYESMNDSNNVFYSWLDNIKVHVNHVEWLESEVKNNNKKYIVLTHHVPSPKAIHVSYGIDEYTTGYATDLDLINNENIHYWVFGHSHESMDIKINTLRCISNPVGYKFEKKVTHPIFDRPVFSL